MKLLPTLPTLDELRATCSPPHYFGLGFVQLELDEVRRYHFWTPDWPTIPGAYTELHNHRYPFNSIVLKGLVKQEIFRLPPLSASPSGEDLEVIEVSCKPDSHEEKRILGYATPVKTLDLSTHAGGQYSLGPEDYHRAHVVGDTISYLERGDIVSEMAMVLRPPGASFSCPFSIEKSEEECWAEIERMLALE